MKNEVNDHHDEQQKAIINILVWQQIQISTLSNMLNGQRILNKDAHLQYYRKLAKKRWIEFQEIIEETIQQLQNPNKIEEVMARLQGYEDDFWERQQGASSPDA